MYKGRLIKQQKIMQYLHLLTLFKKTFKLFHNTDSLEIRAIMLTKTAFVLTYKEKQFPRMAHHEDMSDLDNTIINE